MYPLGRVPTVAFVANTVSNRADDPPNDVIDGLPTAVQQTLLMLPDNLKKVASI